MMAAQSEPTPLGRIRPARWFAHAQTASQLAPMLEIRARMLECSHDGRAAFCRLYAMQAGQTHALIESGVAGDARGWLEAVELDVAHRYLHAMELWDRGELSVIPGTWRAVFAATHAGAITLVDSIRIGVVARVAYDVPLALACSDLSGEARGAARDAYVAATSDRADRAADALRAVVRRYEARSPRDSDGAARFGAWLADMRERAWIDGMELAACAYDDERSRVFGRIEMDALKQIALIARATA